MRSPSHPVPRQPWTVPVRREETLAVRDQILAVGWRPPNHKPKTTKPVLLAKSPGTGTWFLETFKPFQGTCD
jgi:hypothetical protein